MAQGFFAALILSLGLIASNPAAAGVPVLHAPNWVELTPQQREVLAPLGGDWAKMDDVRRRKWAGIALRYPTMKPEEQQRLTRQMQAWAKLTPEERTKAREKFKSLQSVPPEQREALKQKWEQYQSLPPEEKQRLAEKARSHTVARSAAGKGTRPKAVPTPTPASSAVPAAPTMPPAAAPAIPAAPQPVAAPAAVPPVTPVDSATFPVTPR